MEKERKLKIYGLCALIIAVLGLTVAFAALSQTLKINGSASVDPANWNVHFESLDGTNNILSTSKMDHTGAEEIEKASLSDDKKTISYFGFLMAPGDSITYDFKIVNNGTVDAKISSINYSTPSYYYATDTCEGNTTEDGYKCIDGFKVSDEAVDQKFLDLIKKYYKTELYYKDTGEMVKENDVLEKGKEKEVILKRTYDSSAPSSLVSNDGYFVMSANEELTITYVQK